MLAAAELRKWELESEQAPTDELRFWKMTADGGVHVVTVPDALFAEKGTGQQSNGTDQEQQQQVPAILGSRSEGKNDVPKVRSTDRGSKQQHEQRDKPETIVRDVGRGLDRKNNRAQQKQLEAPGLRPAAAKREHQDDVGDVVPTAGDGSTAIREDGTKSPPKLDRFGRKIKTARSADRQKVTRLGGPPEGTLLALGWGWGGEFRIGTGRDGFEVEPRPLHPDFKVRGSPCYLALEPPFEDSVVTWRSLQRLDSQNDTTDHWAHTKRTCLPDQRGEVGELVPYTAVHALLVL